MTSSSDALAEDSDDLGVLRRLGPKIDVDRRDDSGSGAKGRCGADDRGAGRLRNLRDGRFRLWLRDLGRGCLWRCSDVSAVQASCQEHAHQRPLAFVL